MKVLSVVAVLVTLSLTTSSVDSCSCFVSHPQDHYCSADYVAVINVKRQGKIQRNMASYFVKVKRVFKMTPEAQKALNIGTVYTGLDEASCGRKFELNTRYLITGRVIGEKVWVSLCNFVQEWSSLTAKQRKGFRRLYSQGCQCKVREQMSHRSLSYTLKHRFLSLVDGRLQSLPGYCHWETKWDQDLDCQGLYSICAPVHAKPSAESKWSKSDPFVIKKGQVHKKQLQSLSGGRARRQWPSAMSMAADPRVPDLYEEAKDEH
ncbi:Metalloproteinase inhibitor 3 [Halotydeus destructor]|nr:Metalloproteinase inhibitor 3 [Halotydeus destructor]